MTDRLRVGIVGGGYGQHVQVPAFRSDQRASVVALCASTAPRARAIADRLEIPRAFGDWRQLVTDPGIDVVGISVPPVLQAEIVVAAAAAGKHVLTEKPLGMTMAEAQAMVDAVRTAAVVGGVDFEFRELEAWRMFRRVLSDGRVGALRQVYFSWRIETLAHRQSKLDGAAATGNALGKMSDAHGTMPGKASWKLDPARGGGALNLFGSHALDSIVWTFGPVRQVAARLLSPRPGDADARVEAWLDMANGPAVSLSLAADAPFGGGYRIEVYGDEGRLVLENKTSDYAAGFTLELERRDAPVTAFEVPPLPAGADGRIAATSSVVRRLVDAIVNRSPMTPSLEDGLEVQRLIDAMRAADRSGAWQIPS